MVPHGGTTMSNWNDAAQEVTIAAARLQGAVATGSDINVMSEAKRLAYRLGDLIECVTGRKFAGLDMERAVTLIRFSGEGAELAVKEVSL